MAAFQPESSKYFVNMDRVASFMTFPKVSINACCDLLAHGWFSNVFARWQFVEAIVRLGCAVGPALIPNDENPDGSESKSVTFGQTDALDGPLSQRIREFILKSVDVHGTGGAATVKRRFSDAMGAGTALVAARSTTTWDQYWDDFIRLPKSDAELRADAAKVSVGDVVSVATRLTRDVGSPKHGTHAAVDLFTRCCIVYGTSRSAITIAELATLLLVSL